MQRELSTGNHLMTFLRLEGIAPPAAARSSYVESDGRVRILAYRSSPLQQKQHFSWEVHIP